MKGFIFVYDSEVILRFVNSDAFAVLERRYDLTYVILCSDELLADSTSRQSLASRKVRWLPYYPSRFGKWKELFDISCILHKDSSSSFAVRYAMQSHKHPARYNYLEKIAMPGVFEHYRQTVEKEMGVHPDLLSLTLRERPDFFVLPSALLDHMTDDVLQIAAELSVPTLMLVAGWDNLSSKGVLYHQPSMMGVWGEQSKRHAIEVQGSDAERVRVIGAPHYDSYHPCKPSERGEIRQSLGAPTNGKLILFAGTFRTFDETQLLRELEEAISSGGVPDMHIIYRPHPLRVPRSTEDNFFDYTWDHVTMDVEIAPAYRAAKTKGAVQATRDTLSRIGHLERLYNSVDAVISPMSTVLLEAMLFGLPIMAVAFGDGKHVWSADQVSHMLHFKEMYEVPGIIVCRKRADFFQQVELLLSQVGNAAYSTTLRQSANYIAYRDDRSYAERVAALLESMLAGSEAPAYDSVKVKPGKRMVEHELLHSMWRRIRMLF